MQVHECIEDQMLSQTGNSNITCPNKLILKSSSPSFFQTICSYDGCSSNRETRSINTSYSQQSRNYSELTCQVRCVILHQFPVWYHIKEGPECWCLIGGSSELQPHCRESQVWLLVSTVESLSMVRDRVWGSKWRFISTATMCALLQPMSKS